MTISAKKKQRYHVKVIKITGEDSPNVRYARAQQQRGITPTDEMVFDGVLPWSEYKKRRALWDKVRQTIGLDAEWWEGANALLFPPDWLARSLRLHGGIIKGKARQGEGGGLDTAQGGDNTVWTVIDRYGIIEMISIKTANTATIVGTTVDFMRRHNLRPENMIIDRGNGGYDHACRLRHKGHNVRTVGFSEKVATPPKKTEITFQEKAAAYEKRYVFTNRRAQLYGEASILLDPSLEGIGFAIPSNEPVYEELVRQLSPFPALFDDGGRMYLPSKDKAKPTDKGETLRQMLGCSPDEADSFVLAVHAMLHPFQKQRQAQAASHTQIKGKYDRVPQITTPGNPLGVHVRPHLSGLPIGNKVYDGYRIR